MFSLAASTVTGSGSPAIGAFVFLVIMFAWVGVLLFAGNAHNRRFDAARKDRQS